MADPIIGLQGATAAANTTYSGPSLPSAVDTFYNRGLLSRALPFLVYDKFGQSKPMPTNNGNKVKFRRYNSLSAITTTLTDGVTPTAQKITVTDYECSLSQMGGFVVITDNCDVLSIDPVATEFNDILSEQAGESLDLAYRDILHGGVTSYFLASGVATPDLIATAIQLNDVKGIRGALMKAKGKTFANLMKAGSGVGTSPLPACYIAIGHTDCLSDLEALDGWLPVHKYSSPESALEYEVGSVGNVRFILTQQAPILINSGAAVGSTGLISTGGSNIDIYKWLFMAQDSYGKIELSGKTLESIRKPFGAGDDPLNQRSTMGWKAYIACKIVQDAWIIEYQSGCKAYGKKLSK